MDYAPASDGAAVDQATPLPPKAGTEGGGRAGHIPSPVLSPSSLMVWSEYLVWLVGMRLLEWSEHA